MAILQELLIEELRDLLQRGEPIGEGSSENGESRKERGTEDRVSGPPGADQRPRRAFEMLGEKAKAKPCKGMAGLVQEGQEVITEGKEKEEAPADLALIAAAQKVEHYEISAYGTARATGSKWSAMIW